jgi:hypothetical protein
MVRRILSWSGAPTVLVITAVLVVLDVTDASVHRFWTRHSFTSSVLSGVLVLALTVLIVDRVASYRQLKNQSRVIAAQAAIVLGQAERTANAIDTASSADDRDNASGQLRTYTQMLLITAPVLIDAATPRAFLEEAQRLAAQMFRALGDSKDHDGEQAKAQLDRAVKKLRSDAAPLLAVLDQQQRVAVTGGQNDSGDGKSASHQRA